MGLSESDTLPLRPLNSRHFLNVYCRRRQILNACGTFPTPSSLHSQSGPLRGEETSKSHIVQIPFSTAPHKPLHAIVLVSETEPLHQVPIGIVALRPQSCPASHSRLGVARRHREGTSTASSPDWPLVTHQSMIFRRNSR